MFHQMNIYFAFLSELVRLVFATLPQPQKVNHIQLFFIKIDQTEPKKHYENSNEVR